MIVLDVGFLSRLNICTINHNFIKQRAAFNFKFRCNEGEPYSFSMVYNFVYYNYKRSVYRFLVDIYRL